MKFADLLKSGRAMNESERAESLRQLCADPRFAAVVGMVDDAKSSFVSSLAAQQMAQSHGNLAHCAGSIYALEDIEARVQAVADAPKRRSATPPPDE